MSNKFKCPQCGGWQFGSSGHPDKTMLGHCHGSNLSGGCGYIWNRGDIEAEKKCFPDTEETEYPGARETKRPDAAGAFTLKADVPSVCSYPMPMQQGWQCPKCMRVMAPWAPECPHCNPPGYNEYFIKGPTPPPCPPYTSGGTPYAITWKGGQPLCV